MLRELLDQRRGILRKGEGDGALAVRIRQGQEADVGWRDVAHRFRQQGNPETGLNQLQLGGFARHHAGRLGKKALAHAQLGG
ncbi:hypothetical protein D3C76_1754660 [compost metagenome]